MTTSGTAFDPANPPAISPSTATYTTNNLNQYTSLQFSVSSIQLSYDLDGNLIEDNIHQFTYDAENRLTSMTPITPTTGSTKVEFAYDYMSRRVEKQVSTYDGSSWVLETEKSFVYNGWNLIKETTTDSGTTTDFYVWGLDLSGTLQGAGGIGGLLSTTNSLTSKTYLYTFDANGNVGQLVDSNSGTIAAHYEYDPFGNLLVSTGSESDSNVFRFSTKYYDAETELYYYGFRYYDPVLGRWVTRDPIEELGGRNLYKFIWNDSINFLDVLGLKLKIIGIPPNQVPQEYSTQISQINQTFLEDITNQLTQICSLVSVDFAGNVSISQGFPKKNELAGCCCLRELITNDYDNEIMPIFLQSQMSIPVNPGDENWQVEPPLPPEQGPGIPGPGTAGKAYINPIVGFQEKQHGEWVDLPAYILLAHELCGHLLRFNEGIQRRPSESNGQTPPNDEIDAVDIENEIRNQNMIPKRNPQYDNPNFERFVTRTYP